MFTTRPEIQGTHGVVASTHWLASAAAFGILERGGNAFDAAVAGGFVLQVVEPHLNGPGGEVPILLSPAGGQVQVLCGQGTAPAGATIAHYRAEGLEMVPGTGLLAAVVPGAFDAWLTLLRDHGRLELSEVLAPALGYARDGHPLLARVEAAIAEVAGMFREHWPSSAAVFLPHDAVPRAGALFRNPALAATWQRLLDESAGAPSREARIDRARDLFYRGFVAEAIERFARGTPVFDVSGSPHRGVIAAQDLAEWRAGYEAPLTRDFGRYTLCKTGPWGQGPVLLQSLAILEGMDVAAMDPRGPDFVHAVVESLKLAFADREAYYGDPDFVQVPIERLLSADYAAERRRLIGREASLELRPGILPGFEEQVRRACGLRGDTAALAGAGAGEPTMAHLGERRGDTCHIDVADAEGNLVAATPSGGWLQSSPVIPELGFALSTRAQMFWLEEGVPGSLAPGKRPRTTLTPSLALRDGEPYLAFGTPGGDQQDQWQLAFFLHHAEHGLNLQESIDLPLFHTDHFPASFYPRAMQPGSLTLEGNMPAATVAELRARGHAVTVTEDWAVGRLCAAARDGEVLKAAATPRLMQAYAVGR